MVLSIGEFIVERLNRTVDLQQKLITLHFICSGIYGDAITVKTLKDFHRRRVQVLANSGADLIAFETTPNKIEAQVVTFLIFYDTLSFSCVLNFQFLFVQAYAELLEEEDIRIPAWFSFSSKDGTNLVSGDSIVECASIADSCKQVVAIGINCTPPRYIKGLIQLIRKVVYLLLWFVMFDI